MAARQGWRCSSCAELLSSAFQVDHTVPLWDGGADALDNATGMCSNCHSLKTQSEGIERARRRRLQNQAVVRAAEEAHARSVRSRVKKAHRPVEVTGGVLRCVLCAKRYYRLFDHKCARAERLVEDELSGARRRRDLATLKRKRAEPFPSLEGNPFARFAYTTTVSARTSPNTFFATQSSAL